MHISVCSAKHTGLLLNFCACQLVFSVFLAKGKPTEHSSSFSVKLCFTHLHSLPSGSFLLQTTGLYCWPLLTREWNWQLFQPHSFNLKVTSTPLTYIYMWWVFVCFLKGLWVHSAEHLFRLTSLHSSLPQLCKCTRPLCIFLHLFLLTLLRSVLINHPLVVNTAHTHSHATHTRVPLRRPPSKSKDCY